MVSVVLEYTNDNMDQMFCVNIPINDDLLCEGNETFFASLTAGQNAALSTPSQATVTIIDNDGMHSRMGQVRNYY